MLDLFRTCISEMDMIHLYRVLYDKAMHGDVSAAKLIIAYQIGKPAPCPDPDSIDRGEWDHYQQDAIEPQEMKQVLSSLPTRVGNDIARTALPIVTQARTREFTTQLQPECPVSPEMEPLRQMRAKVTTKPHRYQTGIQATQTNRVTLQTKNRMPPLGTMVT
jgi:hypothetical protein